MKIAVAGKGGVGKTTIAGTLARIYSRERKVIAVDSDPSMNLHTAIGMENPTPLSKLKDLINQRTVVGDGIYNLNPKVEDIPERYASQHGNIKLLAMGTVEKGGGGCICPENAFLRALLRHLVLKRDEVLIMDSGAGIEHLGRGTAEGFDVLLIVCEPSVKAIETSNRIYRLSKEIGVARVYGVGNKISSEEQRSFISQRLDFEVLEYVPYDEAVIKADMLGKPLAGLDPPTEALNVIVGMAQKIKKVERFRCL
jgi:CO dehydrogenase maturation factor